MVDAGAARERRAGFVEGEVTVATQAEHGEIEAAGGADRGFVARALGVEVGRARVGGEVVAAREVDAFDQVLAQEAHEGAGVVVREAGVLVEVEGARVRERDALALVERCDFPIHRDHRRAGREREYATRLPHGERRDTACGKVRGSLGVGFDHDAHTRTSTGSEHLSP